MSKPSVRPPEWCLEEIKRTLEVNPSTGIIRAKVNINQMCQKGKVVGKSDGDGYLKLLIRRDDEVKHLRAHNVAWFLYYGSWPQYIIDHWDGDGTNNRKSNLRESSSNKNSWNRNVQKNKTGHRGIRTKKHTLKDGTDIAYYQPRICVNGKRLPLGNFKNLEDAVKSRIAAERKYFGAHALCNRPRDQPVFRFSRAFLACT